MVPLYLRDPLIYRIFCIDLKILFEKDLIHISASFGITQLNEEEKFEKVLVAADKRLYEKKRSRSLKQSSEI